ncbi:MAG: anti-sigma factor family protein [Candidatus Binataceae bacterium]
MAAEKMTCREFVELIGAYHEGDLPAHQQSAFAAHIPECPKCRAYFSSYEATARLARTAMKTREKECSDTLPEELVKAILKLRGRKK